MGTPDAAVPALHALNDAFDVTAVYTRPDRPRGRGLRVEASPVKQSAAELGLDVFQPKSLKTEVDRLASFEPDVIAVVAYGALLRPAVLEIPKLGCVNVHFSLLPRWRGAAPVERAVLAGDDRTGVTTMLMDEGLDTGPMLLREEIPIASDDTAGTLRDRLAEIGAPLLVRTLRELSETTPVRQNDELATNAPKIDPAEAELDPQREDARTLDRKVRAFRPSPGAFIVFRGKRLKIVRAAVEPGDGDAGTFVEGALQTTNGRLRFLEVQPEGKRVMAGTDFVNGYRPTAADRVPSPS
jgi:methionyl-tRNA formyltransferase